MYYNYSYGFVQLMASKVVQVLVTLGDYNNYYTFSNSVKCRKLLQICRVL